MTAAINFILPVCILYLTFLLTCGALLEARVSRRTFALAEGGLVLFVAALQAALLLAGADLMLVVTLLPLTAWLPAIICVHLLSARDFFQTCAVWTAGLLVSFTLTFWQKLLANLPLSGLTGDLTRLGLLLVLAAALLVLVFRFVRTPFKEYVSESGHGWLPLAPPMLVAFLLLSYFGDTTADPTALVLIFLTALALALTLARTLVLTVSAQRTRAEETKVRDQMALQRRDYEVLNKKLELGRAYRHDLRHHMAALDTLLRQGQARQAADYIDALGGQLTALEQERWCENATLNAVLCAAIGQARQAGCAVEADVRLPSELPFDELDLCVVFSNAIENAARACGSLPANRRRIAFSAVLSEGRRLAVSVRNPWDEPMTFDSDGFPIVRLREGHGMGLKSVESVVKKYNGIFNCDWLDGQFTLKAVLFHSPAESADQGGQKPRHRAAVVLTSVFLCLFFLNCMPALAQALEEIPVLGGVIRLVDLRAWSYRWGDTAAKIEVPEAEGDPALVEALNTGLEERVNEAKETFVWYVSRKYEGYVDMDTSYTVLRDDENYFAIRFDAAVNVGGSVNYSRNLLLDKATGEFVSLGDLFPEGSDYVSVLSGEVLRIMERKAERGDDYFLPGSDWPEADWFREIDPDQEFYVTPDGELVLVFEEYEIAPGSLGAPEFYIPAAAVESLTPQATILQQGGTAS